MASGVTRGTMIPEAVAVAGLLALYLIVHSSFAVPAFGQSDAARLAVDAAAFHFSGHIRLDVTDYRVLASPLYIHGLRLALALGVSLAHLPALMTRVSLGSSVVVLLGLHLLLRSVLGRVGAVVAAGFLVFAPTFWLAGTYGSPAAPALAAFVTGLLAFSRALDAEDARRFWKLTGLAAAFVFVSLALSGGFLLSGLAFPGLVLVRRRLSRRPLAAALAVVVTALALDLLYVKCLVTAAPRIASVAGAPSIAHFAATFSHRFPFHWDALTDETKLGMVSHAPGPFLFVVGFAGLVSLLCSASHVRLGVFALAWCFPTVLFWTLVPGNGAEAYFPALPGFLLAASSVVTRLGESGGRQAVFGLLVLLTNYFSDRTGDAHVLPTVLPKTNLAALSVILAEQSAETEKRARGFARLGAPRKALVGRESLPFGAYETMADGVRRGGRPRDDYDGAQLTNVFPGGLTQTALFMNVASSFEANAVVRKLREDGYEVLRQD